MITKTNESCGLSKHLTVRQIVLFVISCLFVFFVYIFALLNNNITYDSTYEYFLIRHPFNEMWNLIPEDYSPPLYSVILKLFAELFGYSLPVLRLFSYFSFVGMLYLAVFPVKRLFGEKVSVFCTLLYATSTVNYVYTVDIRPATFAYFFSTAVVIYSLLTKVEDKPRNYVILCLFSVLAVYTHYVSLVFAFSIYLICIVDCLIKKHYKQIIRYLLCGAVITISYAPWLIVLIRQTKNVHSHFWADELNSNIIIGLINVFVKPFSSFDWGYCIAGNLLIISFTIAVILFVLKKNTNIERSKIIFLLSEIFISLLIFQIVVDSFKIPAPRYYYIFSGTALLVAAVLITELIRKRIVIISLSAACLINCSLNCIHMYKLRDDNVYQLMVSDYTANANEEDLVFLHYQEFSMGIFSYYFPNAKHYISDETATVIREFSVFPTNITNVGDSNNIWKYTDDFYYAYPYFHDADYPLTGEYRFYECPYAFECEYDADFLIYHLSK